jgi:predicted ribosome quality control (RQC) complex YloA/Tae2 family protein
MQAGSRFRPLERRLVAELHTNHWNLLLLDAEERILFVLHPREVGGRSLQTGAPYHPPPPLSRLAPHGTDREQAWSAWDRLLASTAPERLLREVQHAFAYLGPVNVGPVLGAAAADPASPAERRAAFERWWGLALLPAPRPVLLTLPRGPHPYPFPLPGCRAEPVADLLAGMERVATESGAEIVEEERFAAQARLAERRLRSVRQRLERLQQRLAMSGGAERARHFGDLLLAHLAAVPRGAESVRLPDWSGGEVEIPLDPALSPSENATRWYDTARRQTRAESRLPELLELAESEIAQWEEVLAAARAGTLDPKLADRLAASATAERDSPGADAPRLPYRRYRTSGGLEVRVGRGSGDNDRLTFGHARPDDVWLHARSVPGSHVILRWGNAEHAPPARDLAEAAGLAAWFSKARTSGLVAVDWTRRKHVRKPRGAPPGAVIPQRVKTVFVEPDPETEHRLADDVDIANLAEPTGSSPEDAE